MIKKGIILLLATLLCWPLYGQTTRMQLKQGLQQQETVPFQLISNLIIIPVQVNQSQPLYFIVDTGVKNTIITQLFSSDTLTLHTARKVEILGHGDGDPLEAYESLDNRLDIGRIYGDSMKINVMMQDIFQLSNQLGKRIHGIIGYDLLKDFAVLINYDKQRLRFFLPGNTNRWWLRWFYKELPLELYRQKPYVQIGVQIGPGEDTIQANMLIDTGSSESLWIFEHSHPGFYIPEKKKYIYLGKGLNGNIFGWRSRIARSFFGPYEITSPIVAFPDSNAIRYDALRTDRHGTIGADILHRFNIMIDYSNERLFIQRNGLFREPFRYNSTGMVLVASQPGIPLYSIGYIRESSPAETAGLQKGDQLISLNGQSATGKPLDEINKQLNAIRPGQRVRVEIMREGRIERVMFRAEAVIGNND